MSTAPALRLRRGDAGFTMIELLMVLAIAAVLATLAAPTFREMMAGNRLKTHNSALQGSLMLARSEAIKRKSRVVVCKSADQATCATTGDWQQGWIVFPDTDDSGTVNGSEAILEKVGPLAGSFILKGDAALADYVSFSSTGGPKVRASDAAQTGMFTLCQPSGGDARQIELFATGRLSYGKAPVASCTPS